MMLKVAPWPAGAVVVVVVVVVEEEFASIHFFIFHSCSHTQTRSNKNNVGKYTIKVNIFKEVDGLVKKNNTF